ncbi:MAG TPA: membrane protein insertase YidC [Vicinamibacterales bacterium]
MEKRVLLAVTLSFLVLLVYQALVPSPPKRPGSTPAPAAVESSQAVPESASPAATEADAAQTAPVEAPAADAVADVAAREIVVRSGPLRAVFSNRGAVITSWRLNRFFDEKDEPIDLVPADLPPQAARPFSLRMPDPAHTAQLRGALFRTDAPATIDATNEPATLRFEYQGANGLQVRKTFRIDPESYVITYSVEASLNGAPLNPAIEWGPGLGDATHLEAQSSGSFGTYHQKPQAIVYADGSVERLRPSDVAEQPTWSGDFPFAGIDDHYFIATLVRPGPARLTFQPLTAPLPGQADVQREMMGFEVVYQSEVRDKRVYFGPKEFDVLASVDRDLVRSIHFGVFSFLAVPLLRSLKWINALVGNYGWSIIILTVLINAAMFPLRHKSVVSMRKMQELQPQVKAIQDRYSKLKLTDPARGKMNEELMQLYREKGVNPASGCVPMLLTIPVLFAFYSMLSVAVEIRGEPWALWITDLSRHDPLYITPVLMGLTMVWQQRMTPMADPAQARIMMLTPVIFLFFFLWAPSGLVLYWLVSNLLAIGQQYATNRIIGKPVVRQVRPPAERRLKQAGAGKTEGARGAGR